jgi:hypothetical protein
MKKEIKVDTRKKVERAYFYNKDLNPISSIDGFLKEGSSRISLTRV